MRFNAHRYLQGLARTNYLVQRGRVAFGRRFDWVRCGNFLVVSAVRSGSTLMCDYLNCSRQIRCYGEVLGPGHIRYGYPYRMSLDRLRLHLESFFVRRPNKLSGAKIMTFHLDELPLTWTDMLQLLGQPKVIMLYRQSTLDQFTSFKLAERDDIWHVRRPKTIPPIWLDPDEYLAFAERERKMWNNAIAAIGRKYAYLLPYEALVSRSVDAMRGVFAHLGVAPARLRTRFVPTNPRPLWQKIINYKQFAEAGIPDATRLELPAPSRPAAIPVAA